VGCKAGDDVGMLYQGGEGRDVESARVPGVYALAIWDPGNDGFVGGTHVGHGGSGHEKMTCHARVQDGPGPYSIHVDIDRW
jgi:hypothetical protein